MSQTRSRLLIAKYGNLAQLSYVAQMNKQQMDQVLFQAKVKEILDNQEELDGWLERRVKLQTWVYMTANALIVIGIGFLVAFGISNVL